MGLSILDTADAQAQDVAEAYISQQLFTETCAFNSPSKNWPCVILPMIKMKQTDLCNLKAASIEKQNLNE